MYDCECFYFFCTRMNNYSAYVNATETATTLPCIAKKNWFMIGFMPLDSIVIILNLGLLIASFLDKQRLQRQNYTLAVINSALLSNVVHLALKLWGASASIMSRDSAYKLGMTKIVWTVCEAGAAAIGFGVVANACSVIYVTLDSTYMASRSGKNFGNTSRLPAKKRISAFLIAISWIVPVSFIAASTLVWNCSAECWCPSGFFEGDVCPHEYRCSRLIAPLPISFLLTNAALWAFQLLALVAMIIKKYWDFIHSMRPDRSSGFDTDDKRDSIGSSDNQKHHSENATSSKPPSRRLNINLNPRFRMALVLTLILSVCFVTKGVAIVIDAVDPEADLRIPMMVSSACLFLYTVTFPFILITFLPSLRSSVARLVGKITKCC